MSGASSLDVTPEALARFLGEGDGPVVLVNVVRLRPDGHDAYERYREIVGPILQRVGAELVYAGGAAGAPLIGGERWDLVAVVRYPSREAVARLVRDPAFEEAAPLRHAALEAGTLHVFA